MASGLGCLRLLTALWAPLFLVACGAPSANLQIEPAVEELRSADFAPDGATSFVIALVEGGELAVPVLIDLLDHPNRMTRRGAAYALAGIGPQASDAIPGLIRLVANKDYENWLARGPAAMALGKINVATDDVLRALAELLGDESFSVQMWAARAVLALGPEALPTVSEIIRHPSQRPRMLAAVASEFQTPPIALLPALIDALDHQDVQGHGSRNMAARLLIRIGTPEANRAVEQHALGHLQAF